MLLYMELVIYTVVLITRTFRVLNAFVFSHGGSLHRLSSDPREIFKKRGIWTPRRRISIDQSAACLLSLYRHVLAFSVQCTSGYFSCQLFNNGNANGECCSLVLEIKKFISVFTYTRDKGFFAVISKKHTDNTWRAGSGDKRQAN